MRKPRIRVTSTGTHIRIMSHCLVVVPTLQNAYERLEHEYSNAGCSTVCTTCLTPIC